MTACKCGERHRPFKNDLPEGSNERPRQWFVTRRNETASAFNGYRRVWSASSDIMCRVCGAFWRTKAKWVSELENCEYWPQQHAPRVEPWKETGE